MMDVAGQKKWKFSMQFWIFFLQSVGQSFFPCSGPYFNTTTMEENNKEGEEVNDLGNAETGDAGEEVENEDETDAEIEMMKARVAEMEAEAAKIEQLQNTVEKTLKPGSAAPGEAFPASGPSIDARSVYVGNVSNFCDSQWPNGCTLTITSGRLQHRARRT